MVSDGGKWSDQTDLDIALDPAEPPTVPETAGPSKARDILGPAAGLIALFVGMTLGHFFPGQLAWLGEGVGEAFRFLAKAAPYIIYLTLIPAIMTMLKTGSAAKFAGAASAAFVATTLLAGTWAVLVLWPLFQLDLVGPTRNSGFGVLRDVLSQTGGLALTSDPFIAIWFGAFVGIFLHWGTRRRFLSWFCRPVGDVYHVVGVQGIDLVGRALRKAFPFILFSIGVYIPTGIARAIDSSSNTIASSGGLSALGGSSPVTWYFITVGVIVFLLTTYLVAATFFVARYTGFPARTIFKDYIAYVYPFAWATSSSAATIPINLERTENGLKVRKEVREFIIPLGATVNLDGTMVAAFALTVVAGLLVGYKPTVLDLVILVVPLTVVTVGVPGIPGGAAAIAPPIIASFLPLPEASLPAFYAIWFGFSIGLSDQFRTGVNSCDNGLICLMFEHWYPKHFAKGVDVPVGAAEATALAEPPKGPA